MMKKYSLGSVGLRLNVSTGKENGLTKLEYTISAM
jgi:hypothetical protein